MSELKKCSKCGEVKPVDRFYYKRQDCIECVSKRHKTYYSNHKLQFVKRHEMWVKNNPDSRIIHKRTHNFKKIRDINDSYCCEILKVQRGFSKDQITPDLIAAERALIKLKRAVKGIEA